MFGFTSVCLSYGQKVPANAEVRGVYATVHTLARVHVGARVRLLELTAPGEFLAVDVTNPDDIFLVSREHLYGITAIVQMELK